MSASLYQVNEQCRQLIDDLETVVPKDVVIGSFQASAGGISLPITCTNYDSVAQLIMNLKKLDEIENIYIPSLSQSVSEESGQTIFTTTISCNYTNPNAVEEVVEENPGEIISDDTEETSEE